MPPIKYKQKCSRCYKNYVLVTYKDRFPICYECHKPEMQGVIKDKAMKKMFDIPEDFYKENSFLRKIKINYLKYGELTQPQIDAFKLVVDKIKVDKGMMAKPKKEKTKEEKQMESET